MRGCDSSAKDSPQQQHCQTHGGTCYCTGSTGTHFPRAPHSIPRAAFRRKTKQSQEKKSSKGAPSSPTASLPKRNHVSSALGVNSPSA